MNRARVNSLRVCQIISIFFGIFACGFYLAGLNHPVQSLTIQSFGPNITIVNTDVELKFEKYCINNVCYKWTEQATGFDNIFSSNSSFACLPGSNNECDRIRDSHGQAVFGFIFVAVGLAIRLLSMCCCPIKWMSSKGLRNRTTGIMISMGCEAISFVLGLVSIVNFLNFAYDYSERLENIPPIIVAMVDANASGFNFLMVGALCASFQFTMDIGALITILRRKSPSELASEGASLPLLGSGAPPAYVFTFSSEQAPPSYPIGISTASGDGTELQQVSEKARLQLQMQQQQQQQQQARFCGQCGAGLNANSKLHCVYCGHKLQ